jgi:hypothetical protein
MRLEHVSGAVILAASQACWSNAGGTRTHDTSYDGTPVGGTCITVPHGFLLAELEKEWQGIDVVVTTMCQCVETVPLWKFIYNDMELDDIGAMYVPGSAPAWLGDKVICVERDKSHLVEEAYETAEKHLNKYPTERRT